MPACSACHGDNLSSRQHFNRAELRKDASTRRCVSCIKAKRETRDLRTFDKLAPELLQAIAEHAGYRDTSVLAATGSVVRGPLVQYIEMNKRAAVELLVQTPEAATSHAARATAVRTLWEGGYSVQELKKLGVSDDVMRAGGVSADAMRRDEERSYRQSPGRCPRCGSSDLGHWMDDESIAGMGREWSQWCRSPACGWRIDGI